MTGPRILVTGATGKTGGAVARQLLGAGHSVRVLVRSDDTRARRLAALGADVRFGDLFDPKAVEAALNGVDRAYFVPPFHPRMIEAWTLFRDLADEARLESLVVLGQWLASEAHPAFETRQLWKVEQDLAGLATPATLVAPGFFADNYLRLIGFAAQLGVLPSLTGSSLNAPPSNEDIAAVIVAALSDPARHAGCAYRPTGASLMHTGDMAYQIGRTMGGKVRRLEMPLWLFLKAARMQGVPAAELSGFRYWIRDHRQGAFAFHGVTDHVERTTGRPPEPFDATVARYLQLPEAKATWGSRVQAFADFMRTPISPGYDLDRHDREAGVAASARARLAMQDPVWTTSRRRIAETATLASA